MKKILAVFLVCMVLCSQAYAAKYAVGDGRTVVTTAGTRVALGTSTPFQIMNVCAETNNTGNITIGGATVIAAEATRRGVPLAAGDCKKYGGESESVGFNLIDIYIDSTVNGDGVTYEILS